MTRKLERPLYIDMDFGEALRRFARTDPKEVEESMRRAKEGAGVDDPGAQDATEPSDPDEDA